MQSKAKTVAAYLKEVPPDRRRAMAAVRAMVRESVDSDVEEVMSYGMIGWVIPHRVFPRGYHCDPALPVPYLALASQKQYMSLYMMHVYGGSAEEVFLRNAYAKAGKRLDLGKCCLRFKKLEDLELDAVAESIRRVPAREHLARYVASIGEGAWKRAPAAKSAAVKQSSARKRAAAKSTATKSSARTTAAKKTAARK